MSDSFGLIVAQHDWIEPVGDVDRSSQWRLDCGISDLSADDAIVCQTLA